MIDLFVFQASALTALKARHIRMFNDAISDERFDVDHVYATDAGVPKTILALALDAYNENADDDDKRPLSPPIDGDGSGDAQFVTLLLDLGAKVDEVDAATEVAPLHSIVRSGNVGLVEAALGRMTSGSKVNVQDGEGKTPLHCATELLEVSSHIICPAKN